MLMAMMAIRGIYERHQVQSLNHGIGFDTAAIELLLPTYGESPRPARARSAAHWALNPHPTLIPAIETGWVESVHCFGGEARAWKPTSRARPDVFFTGRDGSLRSNRMLCQLAGQYAIDLFIGSTLQMDGDGQLVDGHARPPRRLRRRAEHGPRSARPPPRQPAWLDLLRNRRARSSAAASSSCRWSRLSRAAGSRPSSRRSMRWKSANASGMPLRAGHDLRRRRHATSSPKKASPISTRRDRSTSARRRSPPSRA